MSNVFVVVSSDSYILNQEANRILNDLNIDEFNIIRYDYTDSNPLEILSDLTTISLLGEMKAVIVKNPTILYEDEKEELVNEYVKYLLSSEKSSYLIFLSNKKLDYKLKICNVLKTVADIKEIADLNSNNIVEMIQVLINHEGYKIDNETANEIATRCDNDFTAVRNELDKLMMYKLNEKVITFEDVTKLVNKSLEDDIFALLQSFLFGEKNKVIDIYHGLIAANNDEMRILSAFQNKLQEILYTKIYIKQNYTKDDIAATFKVSTGRAFYMIKNAKQINDYSLRSLIDKVIDLDLSIKSGKIDKKTGLELFILGA